MKISKLLNLKLIKILIFIFIIKVNYSLSNEIFIPFNYFDAPQEYQLNQKDELLLNLIKNKVFNYKFSEALTILNSLENKTFNICIENFILSESFKSVNILNKTTFDYLIKFNDANNFLPTFKEFNRKIEKYYINNDIDYNEIKSYFDKYPSDDYEVNKKLFQQKMEYIYSNYYDNILNAKKIEFEREIRTFFRNFKFKNKNQIKEFLNLYIEQINQEDVVYKIKLLIFEKSYDLAETLIELLDSDVYTKLFKVVLKIKDTPKNMNHLLRMVPRNLRNDELLLYSELVYYRKKDYSPQKIFKIFFELKSNSEFPKYWWIYRSIYAKEMIKERDFKKAYYIVATHKLKPKDEKYYDAEWLAGWISLRFLGKTNVALEHFSNLYNNVSYPISKSRAIYWKGRAYLGKDDIRRAVATFKEGTNYPLQFYGQLSLVELEKLNKTKNINFNFTNIIKDQFINIPYTKSGILENIELKTAYFYHQYLNEQAKSMDLFKNLIKKTTDKTDLSTILKVVSSFQKPNFLFDLSKVISYKNVYIVNYLYPRLNIRKNEKINIPLIHAIIRQESAFKIQANSSVGAKGFMQIMPATAKLLAKQLNIPYDKKKLLNDPEYNIAFGHYYIQSLISQFDNSVVIAIASYNAGPGNAKRWLKDFINITDNKHKNLYNIIDWMEYITYHETRNYVQRVMENIVVYESIFKNN